MQRLEEGIALRQEACQERCDYLGKAAASDQMFLAEKALVKATRACALLEDANFHDRAHAYETKANLHKDLGHVEDAVANFREARRLLTWAERETTEGYGECGVTNVNKFSNDLLVDIGSILKSSNQLSDSEKCFLEVLAMPEAVVAAESRVLCFAGLASICNQRSDWLRAKHYCEKALKVLERLKVRTLFKPEPLARHHIYFLVQLGDAWEGLGDWASAHQCDEQAFTFWARQSREGVYISVLRWDGLALLREGRFLDARERMHYAVDFYEAHMNLRGLNWTQLEEVVPAMATIRCGPRHVFSPQMRTVSCMRGTCWQTWRRRRRSYRITGRQCLKKRGARREKHVM